MGSYLSRLGAGGWFDLAAAAVEELRAVNSAEHLASLVEAAALDMSFRYYAILHHRDLRVRAPASVASASASARAPAS